jgi:hypothetical protein
MDEQIDYPASFGYWLRRRRKALDLTQAELAQQVLCRDHDGVSTTCEQKATLANIITRLCPCARVIMIRNDYDAGSLRNHCCSLRLVVS